MCKVLIPALLRSETEGKAEVEAEGTTVGDVIRHLDVRFPGLAVRLLLDQRLRPGLGVAVDGEISHRGLREPVRPTSEVIFIAAVSGG